MDDFEPWITILIAITPVAIIVLIKWRTRYLLEYANYVSKKDDAIIEHLSENTYFNRLSESGRLRFIKRVRYLASKKVFIGKNGLTITDEMRIKVCAALVQLTFGHAQFKLFGFGKIILYPEVFYSNLVKRDVKGLTGRGVISLSWADFEKGFDVPDDNYNLGLHELAHALHISATFDTRGSEIFTDHFKYWCEHSHNAFQHLKSGQNVYLRDYGASNFHEFFAVCVEHFFESPEMFKEHMPELYQRTVLLFNQDPLQIENDYLPAHSEQLKHAIEVQFGRKPYITEKIDFDLILIMAGLFFGLIYLNVSTENAALNFVDKGIAMALIGLPFVSLYNWFKSKGRFQHFFIYLLFCVLGIGANTTALLWMINQHFDAKYYQESHAVVGMSYDGDNTEFQLESDVYNRYSNLRSKPSEYINKPDSLHFYVRRGILGIPEILEVEMVYAGDGVKR